MPAADRARGFVTVLHHDHLPIPDATGNGRLHTLHKIVATGRAGLIFLIPGREQTLRVNGPACVTADAGVLDRLTPVGKPPRTAIVVEAESVYAHCPKAFVRSQLWDPQSWLAAEAQPTSAEVTLAHLSYPDLKLEDVEQMERDALKHRLA